MGGDHKRALKVLVLAEPLSPKSPLERGRVAFRVPASVAKLKSFDRHTLTVRVLVAWSMTSRTTVPGRTLYGKGHRACTALGVHRPTYKTYHTTSRYIISLWALVLALLFSVTITTLLYRP